jgi:Dual OB-containing domain
MPYKKTIICLANSRKYQGRCVAGLEWDGKRPCAWIRPVSGLEKGVLVYERLCGNANGRDPRLLGLLEIEFLVPHPHAFQTENHRIDPCKRWTYRGSAKWEQLLPAVQRPNGPLWVNAGSSRNGCNDVIPEEAALELKSSLLLLQPNELVVTVTLEGRDQFGEPKRRMRGEFQHGREWYILSVTDCLLEQEMKSCGAGAEKVFRKPLLCLSVGEVFDQTRACYKLIAGVVPTGM